MNSSRCVIDTNVLIGASAVDLSSPSAHKAIPEDPVLRMKIREWLEIFCQSDARLVLDHQWRIRREYNDNLNADFPDFGLLVVRHKWDTGATDGVDVKYDAHGHAKLEPGLNKVVLDRSDRKFVAAALAANTEFGECALAFAGDSDWRPTMPKLEATGLEMVDVIPEWIPKRQRRTKKG
jgi:hypothetical protein